MKPKIFQLIADAAGIEASSIQPETRMDTLELDSLDFMELILTLQKEFAVVIPDSEIAHLNTAQDIAASVEFHLADGA